jgi:hypothetical protein
MKSSVRRTVLSFVLLLGIALAAMTASLPGCAGGYAPFIPVDDFLISGRTLSFFAAVQVDPPSEDSAGPQFVVAHDLNNDGTMDLVSAWNQSQPVQIHLQHRSASGAISFETLTLAGDIPVVSVAGLAVADFDRDGNPDIAVLVKHSGLSGETCLDAEVPGDGLSGVIITYLAPVDRRQANQALAWREVPIGAARLQGTGDADSGPESGGFTAMQVGDIDVDGDMDLVVAWNTACAGGNPIVVVFTNQGPAAVRDGTWIGTPIPDSSPNGGTIKDIALGDIDNDGDLDVVTTYPAATNANVRWYRNPARDIPDDYHFTSPSWQVGTIGHIATGADGVRVGDLDRDGLVDVVVRSNLGKIIQWFRGTSGPTTSPVRAIPWQVYTLAEFLDRTPQTLAIGDLTGDGRVEVIAAADGGIAWFSSQAAPSVYDQWIEQLIVDDISSSESDPNPATTDPNVAPGEIAGGTLIQTVIVADLDGNGTNDLVVTLDRSGLSGLSNDALVWFRSTRRP